jgi:hypothetical protein
MIQIRNYARVSFFGTCGLLWSSFFQVDATVLQLQNQKLVQQLDLQKKQLYDVESKIQELQLNQTSYDDELISVNQLWNQVSSYFLSL